MVVWWASETSNSTPVTQGPIKATSLNPSLAIQQLGTTHANKSLWGILIQTITHHTDRTDTQIHTA